MVYVRFTRDAGLLEVGIDYMRCSEWIKYNFEYTVGSVMYYLLPFRLSIIGVTRSGGFQSSMVVDATVEEENYDSLFSYIIGIVNAYAEAKRLGYLNMDGVVPSIQEPYRELYIKIRPLRKPFNNIELLMDKYMNMLKISGDKPLLEKILLFIRKPHDIPRKPLFNIIRYNVKKRDVIDYVCREIEEKNKCNVNGYLLPHWDVKILIIPNVMPPRRIRVAMLPVCTCNTSHGLDGTYTVSYVYVDKEELERIGG